MCLSAWRPWAGRFLCGLLLIVVTFVGLHGPSAASGGTVQLAQASPSAVYRLSIGDRLRINVFREEDLSGDYEVDASGTITFPLLGQVRAAGQTVSQLRDAVTAALDRDYLVNPRVTVEVTNYRPFFIMGQVNSPGSYQYRAGITIRQAVSLAGGYTRRADTDEFLVIRDSGNGISQFMANEDFQVLPGDTIEVDRRLF